MNIMGGEVICQSLLLKTSEVSESFSFQKLKVFKSMKIANETSSYILGSCRSHNVKSLFLIFATV